MDIWHILSPFGNFGVIWYIFPLFGILCQEKSGNPALVDRQLYFIRLSTNLFDQENRPTSLRKFSRFKATRMKLIQRWLRTRDSQFLTAHLRISFEI
jgi:hypothetical protein